MEIKDRTIALLIDSDNVSRDYFAILLDELSQYGRVTYRRLYGDFSKPNANGWKPALLEYSIEQVQQIAFTKSKEDDKRKEATDSSMIIDAMDILFKEKVDCFCLATSDSDFTKLAMRFRNDNLIVIGAGEKKTPDSFRRACDRFIPIDELLAAKEGADKLEAEPVAEKKEITSLKTIEQNEKSKQTIKAISTEVKKKLAKLIEMALKIVVDGAESDGWMHFSTFMNEVYRKENGFNPKLYGHSNSTPSSFFRSLTDKTGKEVFVLDKTNNYDRIKINK